MAKIWFAFTMIITILGIIYLTTYDIRYALKNNHPECIFASDTVMCVKASIGQVKVQVKE